MAQEGYGDYGAYIGGEPGDGIETFDVLDPATNEPIATVAESGAVAVDAAIEAAQAAGSAWAGVDPAERGAILRSIAAAMREHADHLARVETAEMGRPVGFSKGLVMASAAYFDYFGGLTDKLEGETIPVGEGYLDYTRREPLGVTGHVVPWNASLKLGSRSIAPALAAGNTVVAKPSPEAPLSLLEFADIATEAGLPEGVLNVVPGDGPRTGAALTGDGRLGGLSFTGSRPTGKAVMRAAAEHVVPVGLELGGKSPNVVFEDADLERAAEDTVKAFYNAGQICYAGTRIYVHEAVADGFVDDLVERTEALTVGPGIENPDLGPVISADALERIAGYVDDAVADGAELLAGGEVVRDRGNFYAPTLLGDVDDDAPVACDEIFGPVLTVHEFADEDEVVRRANDTEFGLYAVVWTNDLSRAHRVAAEIEAGTVAVNEFPVTFPNAPFGGYKQSGIGREHGQQALEHYTQLKNVIVNLGG